MRYYIIAGERSGDLHASNLMKAIKRHDPEAIFRGFGGDYMVTEGLDLFIHYQDMAFMGLMVMITKARTIASRIRNCKKDILKFQPDVIILVDYAGFNRQIAKWAQPRNLKVFYYISPKVWAWYQVRTLELKRNVTRMFSILPFEKEFFKKYDWEVDYVGNPVLDAIKSFVPDSEFLSRHKLNSGKPIVALLPGSRSSELQRIVPMMRKIIQANPGYQFVVAAVKSIPQKMYDALTRLNNATLVYDATYDLLSHAKGAIVTSGTATLETGLFKVPQAVVYKMSALEYFAGRMLIGVKYISLVNLIADRLVIKEFIQKEASVANVNAELQKLMEDENYRRSMKADYDNVYKALDTGSASENAGKLMVQYLKESKVA